MKDVVYIINPIDIQKLVTAADQEEIVEVSVELEEGDEGPEYDDSTGEIKSVPAAWWSEGVVRIGYFIQKVNNRDWLSFRDLSSTEKDQIWDARPLNIEIGTNGIGGICLMVKG